MSTSVNERSLFLLAKQKFFVVHNANCLPDRIRHLMRQKIFDAFESKVLTVQLYCRWLMNFGKKFWFLKYPLHQWPRLARWKRLFL